VLKPDPGRVWIQKCKLLVLTGPNQGREVVIGKNVFAIGTDSHNDLVLEDSTVSRRHCELHLGPGGHRIRDLDSTNGTLVQGVKVSEAFLAQGCEIRIGNTRFIFCPLPERVELALSPREAFGSLLGRSVAMRHVFHLAERYAPTDATILIEGETGTGKEVLAEEIHRHSQRRDKPFIVIDCASLAKDLVASELFGHAKGAFTGAMADRVGAFEQAHGGTVFLDEIADLAPDLQPKLLRVIEKKEVRRVGSNQVRSIDVRILSATNRRLEVEVNAGRFREDLYYRMSVVHIEVPPLRQRRDDIPLLLANFMKAYGSRSEAGLGPESDKVLATLRAHDWPGNVRELRNVVQIACSGTGGPPNLDALLVLGRLRTPEGAGAAAAAGADRPFKDAKGELVRDFELAYLRDLLQRTGGNVSQAAREAGIERAYLQRLIRRHGMK
jgi:DNA-binding NtrC family response regulator